MLKYATLGSVSHGTLRPEDLLNAMFHELEWQISRQDRTPENVAELDRLNSLFGACQDECWDADGNIIEDDEIIGEYVNETLPDALQDFAPPYCNFCSHPGDGSDIGYWPDLEAIHELPQYDSVDEALEAGEADDFQVVSDHGNVEVYSCEGVSILGIV